MGLLDPAKQHSLTESIKLDRMGRNKWGEMVPQIWSECCWMWRVFFAIVHPCHFIKMQCKSKKSTTSFLKPPTSAKRAWSIHYLTGKLHNLAQSSSFQTVIAMLLQLKSELWQPIFYGHTWQPVCHVITLGELHYELYSDNFPMVFKHDSKWHLQKLKVINL